MYPDNMIYRGNHDPVVADYKNLSLLKTACELIVNSPTEMISVLNPNFDIFFFVLNPNARNTGQFGAQRKISPIDSAC
ncbi:hypothetical protein AB835_04965 [Candidatus Endobugula sertula]|uniref:Uncharacterized protein n=1 Tax=Candidatus Endobugula sertula TaxID=62101 RepID=A0A1D2QRK1_9GAMM|nr:hypothetical protein AB835_04965 [Candidatus Endobugula sertula]